MVGSKRPNIVLFMVDQLRRDALGCYGNTICRTPNLDAMASGGVRFDSAYTTSPVCSPARASLLTGRYPHNHGVMLNTHIGPAWNRGLDPGSVTFSGILKSLGYGLDYVGKWHVHQDRSPTDFGFDRFTEPKSPYKGYNPVPGTEIEIAFPGGSQIVAGTYKYPRERCAAWQATETGIDFLRQRAEGDAPFFLRIDTMEPHFPNVIPEPYASMYDPAAIPPWPNFDETFEGKPASHLRKHREWHLENRDWRWWSRLVAKYYGDITLIDDCIGRVREAIRESGIADNTVLLFTTDHADSMGSHKHYEKAGTMYEEVFRIPLLAEMPAGRPNGQTVDSFTRLLDLMPTIVELAGGEIPESVDGCSLVPFLRGRTPSSWPDSVYCEHHGEVWGYQSQRMVRTRRWKYVYNPHDVDELYDMSADPYEMHNLAGDPACREVLGEMKARMIGWNDATGDMFKWNWVRWNFPPPILPDEATSERLPLTSG